MAMIEASDHHCLRDDDRLGHEDRRISLLRADHGKAVERQHGAVAEMEKGEAGGEDQQRLAFDKHAEAACLAVAFLLAPEPARRPVVDCIGRDHQHGNDREDAKHEPRATKTAIKPNCQPSRPDKAAPAMLPA